MPCRLIPCEPHYRIRFIPNAGWLRPTNLPLCFKMVKSPAAFCLSGQKSTANDAMERLINTAVFYPDMESLLNALILGEEAEYAKYFRQILCVRHSLADDASRRQGAGVSCRIPRGTKRRISAAGSGRRQRKSEEERRLLFVGMTGARRTDYDVLGQP